MRLEPGQYVKLGQLVAAADKIAELANSWPDDASPQETALADQALAETAEAEQFLEGTGLTLDDLLAGEPLPVGANGYDLQLSGGTPGLTDDPATRALATDLAVELASRGDLDEAAGLRDTFGLGTAPGHDYGLADLNGAIEMSYTRQQQQAAEDAAPMARSPEDRLAAAVGRVSRGTYSAPREVLDFAQETVSYGVSSLTSLENCDTTDVHTGLCRARYHQAGCGSYAGPDMVTDGLRTQMARITSRPVVDADGRTWNDQHGARMTLSALIEASTGQRAGREIFETGSARPELAEPARQARYGFEGDAGEAFTASTRNTAAQIAQQMGIERTSPREKGTQRLAAMALANGTPRRPQHPDYSGAGSRRAALRQPVRAGQLTRVNEDNLGAQPQYRAGQI